MIITIEDTGLQAVVSDNFSQADLSPVVFLHGFTGAAADWSFILNNLVHGFRACAFDLPGHGGSPSPDDGEYYSARNLTKILNSSFESLNLDRIILAGYSMGGRAALGFASEFPQIISGLILESCTAGIEDDGLRNERIESDVRLARKIRSEGVRKFIDEWYSQPLFDSLREQRIFHKMKEERYSNNPAGLANSLISFGAGIMPPLWNNLGGLYFPVLLISGGSDRKYCGIMERMNGIIRDSEHSVMENCGHAAHLEKPQEFINLVNRFLEEKIIKG